MVTADRRRLLPALFLVLALVFLFRHLTLVDGISRVSGNLSLRGTVSAGAPLQGGRWRQARIWFNGVELPVAWNRPIRLITADGIAHRVELREVETQPDRFVLRFSDNLEISLLTDPHRTRVTIRPTRPDTVPPVSTLRLPFRARPGYEIAPLEGGSSSLNIKGVDTEFFLGLTPGSTWDPLSRRLDIRVAPGLDEGLVVEDSRPGYDRSPEDWLAEEGPSLTEPIYREALTAWRDKAWISLDQGLDSRSGGWPGPEGNRWNETTAASWLAEALSRDQLGTRLPLAQSAALKNAASRSWLTAPLLDDIVTHTERRLARLNVETGRVLVPGT